MSEENKKYSLFLDTSEGLTVALLNEDYEVVDQFQSFEKKVASLLHQKIDQILEKQETDVSRLSHVIIGNGPGSYTGIRLAEGFAQGLELFDVQVFSFHHHKIPELNNVAEYCWLSNAFKGDVFIHEKLNDKTRSYLKRSSLEELENELRDSGMNEIYSVFGQDKIKSTMDMILNNPSLLKSIVRLKMKVDPFFYRPAEKEYKTVEEQ